MRSHSLAWSVSSVSPWCSLPYQIMNAKIPGMASEAAEKMREGERGCSIIFCPFLSSFLFSARIRCQLASPFRYLPFLLPSSSFPPSPRLSISLSCNVPCKAYKTGRMEGAGEERSYSSGNARRRRYKPLGSSTNTLFWWKEGHQAAFFTNKK